MSKWTDINAVAYCGLVCAGCSGAEDDCGGCRDGGGDADCAVRACCTERGYAGCWDCADMPCDKGPFGLAECRGTNIALVRCVQARSLQGMLARVRERLGDLIDYGALSGKSEEEVLALLDQE